LVKLNQNRLLESTDGIELNIWSDIVLGRNDSWFTALQAKDLGDVEQRYSMFRHHPA